MRYYLEEIRDRERVPWWRDGLFSTLSSIFENLFFVSAITAGHFIIFHYFVSLASLPRSPIAGPENFYKKNFSLAGIFRKF